MKINIHWRAISRLGIRGLRCTNTVNQNRENKFCVDVSQDEVHWRRVRDVFVAAFHRYPLYEHIIPDKSKRPEFLRRYLDSVYHVSQRGEKSVLVTFSHLVSLSSTRPSKSIIGGSLLLRPCFDGGSWKNVCDEELAEAYERFKLDELDVNAVSRLKSYEKWESDQIIDKLQSAGVPTWDAMFYGIEPKLIGNGNGSNGFVNGVPVLYQLQKEYEAEDCQNRDRIPWDPHNHLSGTNLDQGNVTPKTSSESAFLILGISHCPRAVNFHRKNGMLQIATLPYSTYSGTSPFNVHILYYDPFETGKPEEIQKVFDKFPPN